MDTRTALPLSPVHAAALARVADLREEAERARLARTVARTRRQTPRWPATVIAALRDSLRGSTRRPEPATGNDRTSAICCA